MLVLTRRPGESILIELSQDVDPATTAGEPSSIRLSIGQERCRDTEEPVRFPVRDGQCERMRSPESRQTIE